MGLDPQIDTTAWTPDMSKENIRRMTQEHEANEEQMKRATTNAYLEGLTKQRRSINHPTDPHAVDPTGNLDHIRGLPPGTVIYTRGDFKQVVGIEDDAVERRSVASRRMLDWREGGKEILELRTALADEHRKNILLKEELRAANKILDELRELVS